jgi:subtilisin family serine protease
MHNTIGLLPAQWHLSNTGQFGGTPGIDINVLPVWHDYRGQGIKIAVFDSGVDGDHPDLMGSYLASFSFNYTSDTADGSYRTQATADAHGTFVAGLISANGQGLGLLGVAFESTFTSYANFIGPLAHTAFAKAADDGFDVMNNSWGPTLPFIGTYQQEVEKLGGIEYAAQQGRGGLGLNIVFAAGNEYQLPVFLQELGFEWTGEFSYADVNADAAGNSRFTIAVAAVDHHGTYADDSSEFGFTTPGAPILVSAPGSNVVSTDILGELGYNDEGDIAVSSGTSFAAPIVSGVIALMLQANPRLGYRDVQEILAYSARVTDLADESWHINGAINLNGGGLMTNDNYGFGLVNATAAVRLAESWHKQSTYANEVSQEAATVLGGATIIDDGRVTFTFDMNSGISIEHIELNFSITHEEYGDLVVTLISPSGTESTLLYRTGDGRATELTRAFLDSNDVAVEDAPLNNLKHTLTSTEFWGEDSGGTWTVHIDDEKAGDTGVVHSLALRTFGAASQEDKTYIYNDDYRLMVGIDATRSTLSNAVGEHTLNFAAVSTAVTMDLAAGRGRLDGTSLTIGNDTVISTVITGDGNDTITLSTRGGSVHAGRGDDTVYTLGSGEVDGGAGFNRVVLNGERADYALALGEVVTLSAASTGTIVATQSVQYFDFSGAPNDVLIVAADQQEAQTARFYDLLLGRTAEFEGLAFWNGAVKGGMDIVTVANAFAGSSEFVSLNSSLNSDAFVGLVYQQMLKRSAEVEGLSFWVEQLESGMGRNDLAVRFALSEEANSMSFDHIVLNPAANMLIA